MNTTDNKFISATYQLYIVENGENILEEQTDDIHPFQFITGFGIALETFENNLIGMEKGAEFDFTLQPEEAFGQHDAEGVHKLKREVFTADGHFDSLNVYAGATIAMNDADGNRFMARVTDIDDEGVTIDTNHPLAGKVLNFKGRVVENRMATDQEVTTLIHQLSGSCSCGGGCGGGCGGSSDGGCGGCG